MKHRTNRYLLYLDTSVPRFYDYVFIRRYLLIAIKGFDFCIFLKNAYYHTVNRYHTK